jgi:protein-S-isoprenylcysteine O-methyltransferase Ste14
MNKQQSIPSIIITLLALSIVYVVGTTFFTIELEHLVERMITPQIANSTEVDQLNREIYSGIDRFMATNKIRVIGYTFIVILLLLAAVGLFTDKKSLASLGSVGFILPIYAYFLLHMSFLAGLGILTALWSPFWGNLIRLGDIVYLPYMILVYPFSLIGIDIRRFLVGLFISLGLFLFITGVLAWFFAKYMKKPTADFWIYRFTRHPQYLGWIFWSYGIMLRVAQRHDTALNITNPGASLTWVISTLIIICVAISEEIHMQQLHIQEYNEYCRQVPFMLPIPSFISQIISAPLRFILRKSQPDTKWDLIWVFFIYIWLVILFSLPFVLFNWPSTGWPNWPGLHG